MNLSELGFKERRWMKVALGCIKWRAFSLLSLQDSGYAAIPLLVAYNISGRCDSETHVKNTSN
jgi:hypothetical protein